MRFLNYYRPGWRRQDPPQIQQGIDEAEAIEHLYSGIGHVKNANAHIATLRIRLGTVLSARLRGIHDVSEEASFSENLRMAESTLRQAGIHLSSAEPEEQKLRTLHNIWLLEFHKMRGGVAAAREVSQAIDLIPDQEYVSAFQFCQVINRVVSALDALQAEWDELPSNVHKSYYCGYLMTAFSAIVEIYNTVHEDFESNLKLRNIAMDIQRFSDESILPTAVRNRMVQLQQQFNEFSTSQSLPREIPISDRLVLPTDLQFTPGIFRPPSAMAPPEIGRRCLQKTK